MSQWTPVTSRNPCCEIILPNTNRYISHLFRADVTVKGKFTRPLRRLHALHYAAMTGNTGYKPKAAAFSMYYDQIPLHYNGAWELLAAESPKALPNLSLWLSHDLSQKLPFSIPERTGPTWFTPNTSQATYFDKKRAGWHIYFGVMVEELPSLMFFIDHVLAEVVDSVQTCATYDLVAAWQNANFAQLPRPDLTKHLLPEFPRSKRPNAPYLL